MTKEQHRALGAAMGRLQDGVKECVDLIDRRAPLATVRLHLDDLANLVARMRCAVDDSIAAENVLSRTTHAPGLAKGVRR